jgi:hypothetical protein
LCCQVVEPIAIGVQSRKDRWSVRRPFQVITSKLSRRPILPSSSITTAQRHQQLKYINLSEQKGIYPNAFSITTRSIIPSSLRQDAVYYKSTNPDSSDRQSLNLSSSGRLQKIRAGHQQQEQQEPAMFIDEEEKVENAGADGERWEEPDVSDAERAAHSRHSSLISTAVAVPNINHVYSRVPSVALYETPIFEQDSYLEALQLSRLPCQLLKDPDDCFDSTQLFRQRHNNKDEAPASKKLLATIRILINFHEKYPHLSTFV